MTQLVRHVRGLAIATAVLALSAGAVFASAPGLHRTSSLLAEEPTGTAAAEPAATPRPTGTPEATETSGRADAPATAGPAATTAPTESPDVSPAPDGHGALVSAAARMASPAGFPNHGAWVRCVAHLDGTPATVDLASVTPAQCGISPAPTATAKAKADSHDKGKSQAVKDKAKGKSQDKSKATSPQDKPKAGHGKRHP
jgi:hypothetical protein